MSFNCRTFDFINTNELRLQSR